MIIGPRRQGKAFKTPARRLLKEKLSKELAFIQGSSKRADINTESIGSIGSSEKANALN